MITLNRARQNFFCTYIDNAVLQWSQWVSHERSFDCVASLFIFTCNFTMDANSTIELLHPCMSIVTANTSVGWFKGRERVALFAGSTSSSLIWTRYNMHWRNKPRMLAFMNVLRCLRSVTSYSNASTFLSPHYKWLNKLTASKSLLNKHRKSSSFCLPLAVAIGVKQGFPTLPHSINTYKLPAHSNYNVFRCNGVGNYLR